MKHYFFALSFIGSTLLAACSSPQKLVEKKKYDKAVHVLVKKFSKGGEKSRADVRSLETAFNEATTKDLKMVNYLKEEERDENWERITNYYDQIKTRQKSVQSISPLVASDGYKANFKFVDVDADAEQSKEKTAEVKYKEGKQLFDEAIQKNDRFIARKAYAKFVEMEKFKANYQDGQHLKATSKELGFTNVLLEWTNNSGKTINYDLGVMLYDHDAFKDEEWTRYTNDVNKGWNYHYKINTTIDIIEISADREKVSTYTDKKEIEQGVEYVKDENGELVKDENGDPLTQPKMVEKTCIIEKISQEKVADLTGSIFLFDTQNNEQLHTAPLNSQHLFKHEYATVQSGDSSAASEATTLLLQNKELPFPTETEMIDSACNLIVPMAQEECEANAVDKIKS
ncbi:MAG: hypothetical protein MK212_06160 [Saprospiraceae bacterium]|nr:hypothetical protein [Saprospiraceae bacterium]